MTSWPSWLRRATVNRKIVSSTLTEVVFFWSNKFRHQKPCDLKQALSDVQIFDLEKPKRLIFLNIFSIFIFFYSYFINKSIVYIQSKMKPISVLDIVVFGVINSFFIIGKYGLISYILLSCGVLYFFSNLDNAQFFFSQGLTYLSNFSSF